MDRRYGEALAAGSWRAQHPVPAEAGWNSWYELWDSVDSDAVSANATLAAAAWSGRLPAGAPPLRIVVDDGWQVAWGEWQPNAKFPGGLDGLAATLKADGFEVGVWLAPLLVDGDSALGSRTVWSAIAVGSDAAPPVPCCGGIRSGRSKFTESPESQPKRSRDK